MYRQHVTVTRVACKRNYCCATNPSPVFGETAHRWTSNTQMEAAYELRLIMARSAVATGNLAEAARYTFTAED